MDATTVTRTLLEITRPIPLVGMLTGMASDFLGLISDLGSVPKGNDLTTLTIAVRDLIALIDNMLGAAASVDQKIQDILSVTPAAPADTITASINEGVLTVKAYLDGAEVVLDIVTMAEAKYDASHGPKDQATLNSWDGIFKAFEVSLGVDGIGGLIDVLDIASGGFANGQTIKDCASWIATFEKSAVPLARTIITVVLNEISIHGWHLAPGLSPPAAGNQPAVQRNVGIPNALQRDASSGANGGGAAGLAALDALDLALGVAQAEWQDTDTNITQAVQQFQTVEAQMRDLMTQLNGGQDPFIAIRDAVQQSLDKATTSIAEMTEMETVATQVYTQAQTFAAGADAALAVVNQMTIPDVHIGPPADGGAIAAGAAAAADAIFQLAISAVRSQVDSARQQLVGAISTVRDNAQNIADFNKALQDVCVQGSAMLQQHIATLSAKLGQVQNFEDVVDLLLHEVTEALGIVGGAGIEDVQTAWADVGQAITWAQSASQSVRAQLQSPQGAQQPGEGPAPAPPANPPDDGSQGTPSN
jgi:hypothetical protein